VAPSHLFVIGCARSGTTPLVRLLAAHQNVALGMERYKFVLREMRRTRNPELLTPDLFERDRFLDFRPTDTNLIPPSFERFYQRIEERFDRGTVSVVGDKILPTDPFVVESLAERYPDARFVFIYRGLLRVASSFDVRAADPDDAWPARNDHEMALRQWSEAFDAADVLVTRLGAQRLFVIHPDALYEPDGRVCRALFGFLDLDVTEPVAENFAVLSQKWRQRQEKPLAVDAATQRSLLERVDERQLDRYRRRVDQQLPRDRSRIGAWDRRRAERATAAFEFEAAVRAGILAERGSQDEARVEGLRLDTKADTKAEAKAARAQLG
jgi:hypothetical protein